jgi:exopolysaccharide production protein ExoY
MFPTCETTVAVVPPPAPLPLWKRGVDLACCLLALPVFAVCTVLAAVLHRSLRPEILFFCQERVGHRGRRFSIFKFRTMHVNAETATHQAHLVELMRSNVPMRKMDTRGDNRLVRGAWLFRASGFDELPQIINVWRAEMSIVGPRPCIPYEYEQYTAAQQRRFAAVPGLTGLWQVSGKNNTTFEEMISLDVQYARTRSLWLDVKIILLTVPALIAQVVETRRSRRQSTSDRPTGVARSAVSQQ